MLRAGWLRGAVALAAVFVGGVVISQTALQSTVPNLPLVALQADPLYQRGVSAKPTLTLALSVEYPTVGAAYVSGDNSSQDDTFMDTKSYLGYFDVDGCYTYQQDTSPNPSDTSQQIGWYFKRSSAADSTTHRCKGATEFSGNFLNWASASAIDILRMGLTGGDRVIDSSSLTILQRANLPDGTANGNPSFYNSSDFPAKHLSASVSAAGLVPSAISGVGKDIYVANCRNMMYIGNASEGSCPTTDSPNAAGNNDSYGSYQVRVAVCDPADAASREAYLPGYCRQYPSGNYKPVGNLQKYADKVRVAVFGYLLDDNRDTYGGVLRAPMSYLGRHDYDANYLLKTTPNTYAEWNDSDGTFKPNPRSSSKGISGAINYINQFGRNSGAYKGYDPVSELYYESLRYLEGLPPTADATATLSAGTSSDDGFPVYSSTSTDPNAIPTTWSDPHPSGSKISDYSCVNNNILTIGDVNTHNDTRIPGDPSRSSVASSSEDTGEQDFKNKWTDLVGAFESGRAITYTDGKGSTRSAADPLNPNPNPNTALDGIANSGPPWGDNSSYYMAGMAYWGHTHDIRPSTTGARSRPGMRITTYAIDVNEYGAQTSFDNHSRNQYYLAAKYGGFTDESGVDQGNPYVLSPTDAAKTPQPDPNNSWQRPDAKQEPRNYFLASDGKAMLQALDNIFADLTKDSGNVAGFAVDGRSVAETKSLYQGRFDPDGWHGDVVSYDLSALSSGAAFDPTSKQARWHAADKLDQMDWTQRHIVVGVQTGNTTSALPFDWSDVSAVYGDVLRKSPDPTVTTPDTDTLTAARVDFLRGDRSQEQPKGVLRQRKSIMGDVINSGVVYSGAPTRAISNANYVNNFLSTYANRTPAVFVGANDGMLHAFNAQDGSELFAYIPSWLVPKLNQLTWPQYQHQSYVDATPTVAEADLSLDGSASKWATVLVGGTGGGGQGVYALDVSDPTHFGPDKVLWEFTDATDADLGNVTGRVRILKIKVGGVYKSYAVFGSGVNNYANDGHASTTGDPCIFFLELGKPAGTPWTRDLNYFKVKLPKDATLATATGVINISAVTDINRAAVTLYAGDLQGQFWKIPLNTDSDLSAQLSSLTPVTPQVLFHAKASAGSAQQSSTQQSSTQPSSTQPSSTLQPITSAPALFRVQGHIIAVFGTGKFLEANDKLVQSGSSYPVQSVYAIYDPNIASAAAMTPDDLMKFNITSDNWPGANFQWGVANTQATPPQYAGWYFDFPSGADTGERQIGVMGALPGTVVFNTIMPAGNSCATGGGASYVLSLFSGAGSRTVIKDYMLADPLLLVGDTVIGQTYNDRSEDGTIHIKVKNCTTEGCNDNDVTVNRKLNRISWRELFNYEEIKNASSSGSTPSSTP